MYAIIADGGKQYMVREGQKLFVETRELPEGATSVEFDQVLMVGDGEAARVGTPVVAGARVTAKLVGEIRGPKEIIVKFRRRLIPRPPNRRPNESLRLRNCGSRNGHQKSQLDESRDQFEDAFGGTDTTYRTWNVH